MTNADKLAVVHLIVGIEISVMLMACLILFVAITGRHPHPLPPDIRRHAKGMGIANGLAYLIAIANLIGITIYACWIE